MILDAGALCNGHGNLAAQQFENFFQFRAHLPDDLLALRRIRFCFVARQFLPRTADGKPIVIQQAAYLPDNQHILTLVIAPVTASLYRLELRKFLFPVPEHMRLYGTKVAHFTNGEIAFTRNWWQFVVIPRFQHRPLLGLLVFVPA